MTMVHRVAGFGRSLLAGLGFRPATPSDQIHIRIGYLIDLLAMVALAVAGAGAPASQRRPHPNLPVSSKRRGEHR